MGKREHFRTDAAAFAGLCVVLGIALGCGRAIRDDHDADASSGTGGSAAKAGNPEGGSPGSGGSGQGGSAEGGSAQGGGSAEGGTAQGGMGGGGEGGESTISPHLLLQSANALLAVALETTQTIELCPEASAVVRYTLLDWVNERAILHRQYLTSPSAGEFLRVALDGSECASILLSESVLTPLLPVVGGRIVFTSVPTAMSAFEQPHRDDLALRRTTGLSSIALDGTGLAELAPNGLIGAWIVGERVVQSNVTAGGYELTTAMPDASAVITPVPVAGPKSVSGFSGRRIVVNVAADVYAVDVDGENLAPLATGPDSEYGAGIVGNRVVISHQASGASQSDLSSIDLHGGELTKIASSSDHELFVGPIGERVVYERNTDLYSARLDGSDTLPITQTAELHEFFAGGVGERVVFGRWNDTSVTPTAAYFSAALDGSGTVTLHERATGLAALVGDRVVLQIGYPNYDLVSVPVAGGEPWLLADGAEPDRLVGRLDPMLVIHRGEQELDGQVFRINVDGSNGALLADSARYVGAVAERCGTVRAGPWLGDCTE